MKQTVDARGLACPQPVVSTSKAIAAADEVTVIVDNAVAVENVTRFARSKGFSVEVSEKPDGTYLTLRRQGATGDAVVAEPSPASGSQPAESNVVLFIPSDSLGRGSQELGERLMGAFFHTLAEAGPRPRTIIFMNSGVKLTVNGSRALEDLRTLAAQGTEILACGTCLGYYELSEELAVGHVSNMYDIANALLEGNRVVEL